MKPEETLKKEKGIKKAITDLFMTKEAIASCALDGETQCGNITIEPKEETLKKEEEIETHFAGKGEICCQGCYRLGILSQKAKEKEFLRRLKEVITDKKNNLWVIDKLSEEIL